MRTCFPLPIATLIGRRPLFAALGCSRASDSLVAQVLIAVVIFTTIQAQDFKDVEGDILVNRQTLPILFPTASRVVTSLLVPLWSLVFAYCYPTADPMVSSAAVVLGAIIGTRFWFERTREGDKRSYLLYNVRPHQYRFC